MGSLVQLALEKGSSVDPLAEGAQDTDDGDGNDDEAKEIVANNEACDAVLERSTGDVEIGVEDTVAIDGGADSSSPPKSRVLQRLLKLGAVLPVQGVDIVSSSSENVFLCGEGLAIYCLRR